MDIVQQCEGAFTYIFMPWRCIHGCCHKHPTRFKYDVMASDKCHFGSFSNTLMKYKIKVKNDNPGMDAHSFWIH